MLRRVFLLSIIFIVVFLIGAGSFWWYFHRTPPDSVWVDPPVYMFSPDGKLYGLVDLQGNVRVQPIFDEIVLGEYGGRPTIYSEGLLAVKQNGKYGYIDTQGKTIIPMQYDNANLFHEGLAAVEIAGRVGFIDKTGHIVINPRFDASPWFTEGLAAVKVDGKWGYIDSKGAYVVRPRFNWATYFSQGLAPACVSSAQCGYIDRHGKFIIPPTYEHAAPFSEGLARVMTNKRWGYINREGTMIVEPQFDTATEFVGGSAIVGISKQTGTIDLSGAYKLPLGKYTILFDMSSGHLSTNPIEILTPDGTGLLTSDGQTIIAPQQALSNVLLATDSATVAIIANEVSVVSRSGAILTGSYKGAPVSTLNDILGREKDALEALGMIVNAEKTYRSSYPDKGYALSLDALGPAESSPDASHADLLPKDLAAGSKGGYSFTVTASGSAADQADSDILITATPAQGQFGKVKCVDMSGNRGSVGQGKPCVVQTQAIPQQ
jgi:hypothetical protein